MSEIHGKLHWIFPDGELPPPGDSELKGHESIIVLNMSKTPATVEVTLFFTDREPVCAKLESVDGERVRCFRMDNPADIGGNVIPKETQYAIKLESDVPIIAQYGRLDTRQVNMAFYTTMGFSF
ncbi:sensory rhodopsin transducer [Aneurinibacillus sp. REN35]|uniref:sensory rhodopsin transducer n=1 Tax=Aneurinibacillus sp. REN35 TaxID=3237286 RepID=UPI00352837C9